MSGQAHGGPDTARAVASAATLVTVLVAGVAVADPIATPARQCPFVAGQTLADTAPEAPRGEEIPIDHIVVVLQENRSFDHYFQGLPAYGQPDVDVAPANASNVDRHGKRLGFEPARTPCTGGPPHSWNSVHRQIGDGRMDGFAESGGRTAMTHYDERTLPYYYALADAFAISDRWFSSVPGPTFPNRMFMVSATSFGRIRNEVPPPSSAEHSIFDQLEDAGQSWGIFTAATPSLEERILPRLRAEKGEHFFDLEAFFEVARSGELPAFSWVTSAEEHNEHPPKSVQAGQQYVSGVIEAVMSSPDWPRTALFLTYDEHGGFYDHVAPPAACPPDDTPPQRGPKDVDGGFDRLGPRVPLVLVSPYAKRHHVSHVVHDHTSILRFVQARFELPALSARDANARAPFELFDFASAPDLAIPPLPEAVIDPASIGHCEDTKSTNFDDEPPDPDR